MQERIFFRNIPLSNWIEREMLIEDGLDTSRQLTAEAVFTPPALPTGDTPLAIAKLLQEVKGTPPKAAPLAAPVDGSASNRAGAAYAPRYGVWGAIGIVFRLSGLRHLCNPLEDFSVWKSMMRLMAEPLVAGRVDTGLLRDFGTWMTSEQRRVNALCRRLLQDPDEADSATQDVFLKAYQALLREEERGEDGKVLDDPTRWLSKIAVNTCLDRLRSKKWQIWRRRPAPEDEATILSMTASQTPESEDRYFAGQISGRLTAALARLSDRQRAVFTLRHYEEMSLEEIGQILGLDVGTVKAHMFRAVSKLRVDLRDLYEGRQHERARTFK